MPAEIKKLLIASFLMSCCNTMQSVLYVPAAIKLAGSERTAATLLASLHSLCAALDILAAPSFGAVTPRVACAFVALVLLARL